MCSSCCCCKHLPQNSRAQVVKGGNVGTLSLSTTAAVARTATSRMHHLYDLH